MTDRPHTPALIPAAQVAAALAVGSIAVLMVGLQPIVLGELVEARRVSLEGVGIVAMAEIVMLGLGVVLGDALLPIARLRAVALLAALAAAGLDGLTLQVQGDGLLAAVRAAAGLAEGVLVWVATGVVVRTASPARVGGIFFVLQTLAQALVGALLAHAVIPHRGWAGSFVALALLALLAGALAALLPARLAPLPPAAATGLRWSARTLQPLGVAFLQLAALGAFWAYLEPLGKAAGFDARGAQTLVAAALAMQVAGGSLATVAVRRLPALPAVLGCSAALAGVTGFIHQLPPGSTRSFALACAVFGFVWLFMLPFHIGLALRTDSTGRLAGLVPAAQLLGSAFGPLTASFIVQGDNAAAVPLLSAGFAGAAAVLALAVHAPPALQRRTSGHPPSKSTT